MWYNHTNFVQDIESSSVEKRIRGYYVDMQFTSMRRKMEIEQRKKMLESRKQKKKTIAPSKRNIILVREKEMMELKEERFFFPGCRNAERGTRKSG